VNLKAGDYFGEMSLLHDEVRTASVVATEDDTELMLLTKADFDESGHLAAREALFKEVVSGIELFAELGDNIRTELQTKLRPRHFTDGEVIIKQGETGDCFYIIMEGEARLVNLFKLLLTGTYYYTWTFYQST
jgi:cAMP-dependent protein kinase regulator